MQHDRSEFVKTIKTKKPLQTIIKDYFDELMAMYDLIGRCEGLNIEGEINKSEDISFKIVFADSKAAKKLFETVNQSQISKYDHCLTCDAEHIDNTLYITLHR